MNQTDFRTYKKLKEDSFLTEKAIPKTVLSSPHFKGLVSSLILEKTKSGRGFRYEAKADEAVFVKVINFAGCAYLPLPRNSLYFRE